jgi:antitoxin (DNA-binding transcriptional repressor) of toxin-antitoxin stability system
MFVGRETEMAQHSIADAKDHIAAIMEAALAGETVVFVDDGAPVLELRRATAKATLTDIQTVLDEISRRTRHLPALGPNVTDLIREMRDEEL